MSSARRVSPYRSRSNVRPSASVPENVSAIQRMPDAASSAGTPSFTNATEKIRRQEMAKKSVVYRISRLLASMARSFFSTRIATLKNMERQWPISAR